MKHYARRGNGRKRLQKEYVFKVGVSRETMRKTMKKRKGLQKDMCSNQVFHVKHRLKALYNIKFYVIIHILGLFHVKQLGLTQKSKAKMLKN